ncbi:MAG: response regulator [Candidatus Aminicenantes bacterium]|nr:response regulator [Candidatus Aminicenantes bacterium]
MDKKVLVIDDEFRKIRDLFQVIQAKGHSLEGIDNIDDALEKLKKTQYDLIILDIIFPVSKDRHFDETDTDMGRRTGIEMLREIKSKYGPVPVIILSARRPDIFEDLSKGLGAEKYLPKPISPRDLWDNIKEYLED